MADTYTTECHLCHCETDCIENLCLECRLNEDEYFNQKNKVEITQCSKCKAVITANGIEINNIFNHHCNDLDN